MPAPTRARPPADDDHATLLASDAAIAYWEKRHTVRGELQSGGHLGFDHQNNEIFYSLRLGRLIDAIGDVGQTRAPLRVLDAGCGKGYFSRAMAKFGHRVDGIDVSPRAIDECRALAAPAEHYEVSTIDAWAPPYFYDAVYSVDVLFHILDDAAWEASLRNLAALTRLGGRFAVADHDEDVDRVWGEYQITRAGQRYRDVMSRVGMQPEGFVPYGFRDSITGFHVFTRVG